MAAEPHYIDVDLKKSTHYKTTTVTQNDTDVVFILRVSDDGRSDESVLDNFSTVTLTSQRRDGQSFYVLGEKIPGTNEVRFALGTKELELTGKVSASAQLYSVDGRQSSAKFNYNVEGDLTGDYVPTETEITLIEVVLGEGPQRIAEAVAATEDAIEATAFADQTRLATETVRLSAMEARDSANDAAALANTAAETADTMATAAEQAAALATTEANDARAQKEEVQEILSTGPVASVNGQTGIVSGLATQESVNQVTAQLADKAKQSDLEKVSQQANLYGYTRYGELKLPSDFHHNLNFLIYRDRDGKMKHNFEIDDVTKDYDIFYVDEGGNTGNDGRTEETPWQTMNYAIDQIEANSSVASAKVIITSDYLTRAMAQINAKTLTKNYCFESLNGKTYMTTAERNLTYTLDAVSGLYIATRTGTTSVYDTSKTSLYGFPLLYVQKLTLTEAQNTKGSWYTDGSKVYVHTIDDRPVDKDIYTCLDVPLFNFTFGSDVTVIFKDLICLNGSKSRAMNAYSPSLRGHLITSNVVFLNNVNCKENSVEITGVENTWLFKTITTLAGRDGFNYHANNVGDGTGMFALEFDCVSYRNGLQDTVNFNNNCSTAHDGMNVLRIGTIAHNSKGPVIADVNGCYSILIDGVSFDSDINTGRSTKVAYYFDNAPSTLSPNPDGKAILLNCEGGGDVTWAISGDASMKNGKIQVVNFAGNKFPEDLNLTLYDEVTQ